MEPTADGCTCQLHHPMYLVWERIGNPCPYCVTWLEKLNRAGMDQHKTHGPTTKRGKRNGARKSANA